MESASNGKCNAFMPGVVMFKEGEGGPIGKRAFFYIRRALDFVSVSVAFGHPAGFYRIMFDLPTAPV